MHDLSAAEDIAIDAFSDPVVYRHRYNFKVTLKTYLLVGSILTDTDRTRYQLSEEHLQMLKEVLGISE